VGCCRELPAARRDQAAAAASFAVLLWVVRERRWSVLLGAVGAAAALVVLAMAADPAIVPQFLYMAAYEAPQAPASTLGTLLRAGFALATGREYFWLQFVPPLLSLLWFLPYWSRHRAGRRWERHAPILLLISLATTAYGWIYDQIVLLVPVVQIVTAVIGAGRLSIRTRAVAGYIAVNGAILAMNVAGVGAFWYIWVPFGFAAWWLVAREEIVTEMPAIARVRLPGGDSAL